MHWLIDTPAEDGATYDPRGVELGRVLQVADAFIDLLDGKLTTTAATSPVLPVFTD